ncbi:MMS19 nucleotide excision repair protein homolog [Bradysia coprophila]|uniref:MMS19 nucleotide excision repair protein homolog n=1 Tax=Bradysia coprophila TaxID=38358 RepID=UPI00187DB466|nr:MMS19 nucleotide excision repair protein homolog [Bradysia coprophila]
MTFNVTEESIKRALENGDHFSEAVRDISHDIESKKTDISTLVESLGFALISTEVELRAKATNFLSTVMATLPKELLNDVQLNFISTFYCDRLKDHHSVMPGVFTGMVALASMKNLPQGSTTRLLQSMFQHISCQSQVREDREKIFEFLRIVSERQSEELLAMGPDFVYGVINSIDGERDPRILIQIFDFLPAFFRRYPLRHLAEEFFEVCACYFPVDFHPAPNDPAAITRDKLAEKLANCLCGTEDFAEFCIPLLLEKLDSGLNVAKLDSLRLLTKASTAFKASDIESQFTSIWLALKVELLPGTSKDVTVAALNTLQELIKNVAVDEATGSNLLTTIFDTILQSLADVDARLFIPSTAVALVCARGNTFSAKIVSSKVLPVFLTQIRINSEKTVQRCTLIDFVAKFLVVCNVNGKLNEVIEPGVMDTIQRELLLCIMDTQSNQDLIEVGVNSFTKISAFVSPDNRVTVYDAIQKYLGRNDGDVDVKPLLKEFANVNPIEVHDKVVSRLLNDTDFSKDPKVSNKIFDALCVLIGVPELREEILKFIFKSAFDMGSATQLLALQNLRKLLETTQTSELLVELSAKYKIVDQFVQFVHNNPALDSDILYQISIILRLVVQSLDAKAQQDIVKTYLTKMNLQTTQDLYLTSGILGFLDDTIDLEDHFDHIVSELTKLALLSADKKLTQIAHHLLCSLFNRADESELKKSVLKRTISFLKEEIVKGDKKAVEILSWIAKGLMVRGHTDAAELVESILELLDHPTLAHAAALAFEIISLEHPGLHLPVLKHLFKQKLFQIVLKKLWSKLVDFTEHHLTAFVHVLRITPHIVLKMNLDKVGPILFKCLESQAVTPLLVSMDICNGFLKDKDSYFQDHFQHIIANFLRLTKYKDCMKVRIAALQCLLIVSEYPVFVVVPYKYDVLRELQTVLDDPKRLVRNAAVQTRNRWFLIGSAEKK